MHAWAPNKGQYPQRGSENLLPLGAHPEGSVSFFLKATWMRGRINRASQLLHNSPSGLIDKALAS